MNRSETFLGLLGFRVKNRPDIAWLGTPCEGHDASPRTGQLPVLDHQHVIVSCLFEIKPDLKVKVPQFRGNLPPDARIPDADERTLVRTRSDRESAGCKRQ